MENNVYIKKNGKLVSVVPETDTSHLETKEDALDKLQQSNVYTDDKFGDAEHSLEEHAKLQGSLSEAGHVELSSSLNSESSTSDGVAGLI